MGCLSSTQLVNDGPILFGDVFKKLGWRGPSGQHGNRRYPCARQCPRTFRLANCQAQWRPSSRGLFRAVHPRKIVTVPYEASGPAVRAKLEHDLFAEALIGSDTPEAILAEPLQLLQTLHRIHGRKFKRRKPVRPSEDRRFAAEKREALIGSEIAIKSGSGCFAFSGSLCDVATVRKTPQMAAG